MFHDDVPLFLHLLSAVCKDVSLKVTMKWVFKTSFISERSSPPTGTDEEQWISLAERITGDVRLDDAFSNWFLVGTLFISPWDNTNERREIRE